MSNSEPPWDLYRSFREVAKEGSLSAAARALGLTQPTLARHIAALEAHLGRRLFLRSQRGLAPTEAARADAALRRGARRHQRRTAPRGDAGGGRHRRHGADHRQRDRRRRAAAADPRRDPPPPPGPVAGARALQRGRGPAAPRRRHRGAHGGAGAGGARRPPARRGGDRALRPRRLPRGARHARRASPISTASTSSASTARRRRCARWPGATPGSAASGFGFRADSDLAQLAAIRAGFGIGACQAGLAARDPALVRVLPRAFAIELPVWLVMHEDLRASPRCRAVFDLLAERLGAELD